MNKLVSYRHQILVFSIGLIYLWFGALKFFPGVSPAETLAKETIQLLTFGLIPSPVSFTLLAIWEVLIGLLFIFQQLRKFTFYLVFIHLVFTFSPLVLFPSLSFQDQYLSLTLIGQYILKNLVLLSALLYIYPGAKQSPAETGKLTVITD